MRKCDRSGAEVQTSSFQYKKKQSHILTMETLCIFCLVGCMKNENTWSPIEVNYSYEDRTYLAMKYDLF